MFGKYCDNLFLSKTSEHDNHDVLIAAASVFMFAMQQLHRGCLRIFLRCIDFLSGRSK